MGVEEGKWGGGDLGWKGAMWMWDGEWRRGYGVEGMGGGNGVRGWDGEWDMGWREGMWGRKGWDVGVGCRVGVRGWDAGLRCGGGMWG